MSSHPELAQTEIGTKHLFATEHPSYLENLNEAQLQAVQHGLGPLLIFAGAGSGKTRVLTRRIAHLIHAEGAHPGQILAVTFTNKAAREMKHRVEALFPGRSLPIWVSTFHSTCVRILRQHARLLEFTEHFAIYDSSDSLSALKRTYKKLHVDPKLIEPRTVMSQIDRAKNNYEFPEHVRNNFFLGREFSETIADLYEGYQAELRASNAMDFGDLICNVVTLFKLEPQVLENYQRRFRFLLVDEYQDTNKVQYMLIRQLTEKNHNICVVGDDDQSIYGFRGASVETILNFRKDFPESTVVTLDINYRSSANILAAANAVIQKNQRREPKKMRTPNEAGFPLVGFKAFDEKDEAEFVVRELIGLFAEGIHPQDVAIFYRTNAQSRAIEEALLECNLPYQIFGGHRFYDRKEIKDILAYYKLLLNPKDNEAFLRIINTPARGIGPSALAALMLYADKLGCSLLEGTEALRTEQAFNSKAQQKKLVEFADLFRALLEERHIAETLLTSANGQASDAEQRDAIAQFIKAIAEKSGYFKFLALQESIDSESRTENIHELCRVAIDFTERCLEQGVIPSLNDFLDRASLSSDLEQENSASSSNPAERLSGHISMMTLHLAKGLEFDTVFMLGLEEGILPHMRSLDERDALEEERRLCYVGITRAKRKLYLSRATDRQSFGRGNFYAGIPSRFLSDIPGEVLDDRRSGFLDD